jgi:phospholipid transport system transporter-binding protein
MVALPSAVTLAQATTVLRAIEAEVPRAEGELLVDARALQSCDSSALALLLEAHRLAQARGLPLRLLEPPAKLAALAALYGVDDLLALRSPASSSPT